MLTYIAGPISLGGTSSKEDELKFKEKFYEAEARLEEAGDTVINPCDFPECKSWEEYMRHGVEAVANCDRVVVLPRFNESRGAMLESFIAMQLKIPVVTLEEALRGN